MPRSQREDGPRSLSTESGTGFSRVQGRRRIGRDARSRKRARTDPPDSHRDRSTGAGAIRPASNAWRTLLYAAVAAALLATGVDAVLTAAAGVDLSALVRGDPWLLADLDAALSAAAALAGQVAVTARVFAAASLSWAGLRLAMRWRA